MTELWPNVYLCHFCKQKQTFSINNMSKDGQQILIINANAYRYDVSILFLKSQNREEFLNRYLFTQVVYINIISKIFFVKH